MQNDDHFNFTGLKASTTYSISGLIGVSCPNTGGFKWAFSLPAGASGRLSIDSGSPNLHVSDVDISTGSSNASIINPTTVSLMGKLSGYITTTSAGDAIFQWAQHTSNGTATYIERGSTMILTAFGYRYVDA